MIQRCPERFRNLQETSYLITVQASRSFPEGSWKVSWTKKNRSVERTQWYILSIACIELNSYLAIIAYKMYFFFQRLQLEQTFSFIIKFPPSVRLDASTRSRIHCERKSKLRLTILKYNTHLVFFHKNTPGIHLNISGWNPSEYVHLDIQLIFSTVNQRLYKIFIKYFQKI